MSRFFRRRKFCRFTAEGTTEIDYKDVATLKDTGRFVKITASGINESHPHDVAITKESPNYSR